MRNNQSTLSLVFIFILLVYVLKLFGIITLSTGKIISYAFLLYGIVSVHLTLGTHRRAGLFLGTSIFLTGVVLFIVEYFDIIQPGVLVLPSLLFIVGIGFLMLFFDDYSNRVFLYTSGVLVFFSFLSAFLTKKVPLFGFAGRIASGLLDYYPVFIILLGVYFLLNRKR
ncbi:MAG: hypothetical protein HF309_14545 [Ignavibacteria bacterium]|nr:hypothetical protein [Ignavibacteria bacterium]